MTKGKPREFIFQSDLQGYYFYNLCKAVRTIYTLDNVVTLRKLIEAIGRA